MLARKQLKFKHGTNNQVIYKYLASPVILIFAAIIIQMLLYRIFYGSFTRLFEILWFSEIVYFSKHNPSVIGSCTSDFSNLVFPDPLFYSYISSIIAINYIRKAGYKILPNGVFLYFYMLFVISEFIESIIIMAPFRGSLPQSIPLHITWMIDDFIIFLVLFKVIELWVSIIRKPESLRDELMEDNIEYLFHSWLTVVLGWIFPWIIYASIFYYTVASVCNLSNQLWFSNLKDLAIYGFPLSIVFTGLITGSFYGLTRLAHGTNRKSGKQATTSLGTIISSMSSGSIMLGGLKSLFMKVSVLINKNAFEVVIGYTDLIYAPKGFGGLIFFYMSLISYWFTNIWLGEELVIRRLGIIKLKRLH